MANTRDAIGEQATLDGLVAHTLTDFEEDGVTTLANYAFREQKQMTSIRLPRLVNTGLCAFNNCTGLTHIGRTDMPLLGTVGQQAFYGCNNLEDIDLPEASSIQNQAFQNCSKLESVILRKNAKATLSSANAFDNTPIADYNGVIYVPDSLVDAYKADAQWGNFFIASINNYPVSSYEVSETWAQIEANGGANLSPGDRKSIKINGVDYQMILVGKQVDDLVSGGKANTTWLGARIYENHRMNATNTTAGGYSGSELRAHIVDDILPNVDIKDLIKEVVKISSTYENGALVKDGQTSNEKLWIPSTHEVGFGTTYETTGAVYSFLSSDAKRIRKYNGSASYWWLRSAGSSAYFRCVGYNGSSGSDRASVSDGVVLGFCL